MQALLETSAGLAPACALFLLRASALLALALAATRLMHRASAAARSSVWRAALAGVLLLPFASAWLPPIEWPAPARAIATPADLSRAAAPVPSAWEAFDSAAAGHATRAASDAGLAASAAGAEAADPPASRRSLPAAVLGALVALFAASAALALASLARGVARAATVVRAAKDVGAPGDRTEDARGWAALRPHLPPGVRLLASDAPEAPFVLDLRPLGRAALVVPRQRPAFAGDSDAAAAPGEPSPWQRAVLLHELQHLERRDGLFSLLARIAAACAWPSPLAWLALRRAHLECERACDDAVLRAGVRPTQFASWLVALASAPSRSLEAPSMAAGEPLEARLRALLAADVERQPCSPRARAAAFLATGALLWPLAALAPAAQRLPQAAEEASQQDAAAAGDEGRSESTGAARERAALWSRGLAALVAMQDPATGAWRGDVGYKLNWSWRVTAADAPHVGVTALAVEALVAAGQQPGVGPFGEALARGVRFLLGAQREEGYVSAHGTRMREHAHALRALALTWRAGGEDPELRRAVERALLFSVRAQARTSGGWRFAPDADDGDLIETAFQLDALAIASMALTSKLEAAELAPLAHELRAALERGVAYARSLWILDDGHPRRHAFRYQQDEHARVTAGTTAAGLVALALDGTAQPDALRAAFARFEALRRELETSEDVGPRHFVAWDADLLASRALAGLAGRLAEGEASLRDAWWAEDLGRLRRLADPDGAWRGGVGPGDAYSTALACLRLAAASGGEQR